MEQLTPSHLHPPTGGGNRTFLLLARATEEMEQYTSKITRGGHHCDGFYWSWQCWSSENGGWNTEMPFCLRAVKNDHDQHCLLSLSHVWKIPFICSEFKTTEGILFLKCIPSKLTYSDPLHSKESDFWSTYLMQWTILIWKYLFWKTKDLICFILSAKQPDVMNLFKLQTIKWT